MNLRKEQMIQGFFNSIAPHYDRVNTVMSLGRHHYWRRFMVDHTQLKSGDNALDLCCGTGLITLDLAKKVAPSGRVTGIDFSPEMLAIAVKRLKNCPWRDRIQLLRGNVLELPFANDTFDCVTIGYGLRNVSDLERAIGEAKRVVKSGGRIVSLEMGKPYLPVFKELYFYYLNHWVPLTGRILAKNFQPYHYLQESIISFPHQRELTRILSEMGLKRPICYELTWGVAVVHVAEK